MAEMAGKMANVVKGPLFYYLDRLSQSDASMTRLQALLTAMEQLAPGYRGLVDVFTAHIYSDLEAARIELVNNHIRQNWFNENDGWWPEHQPIEPIFCQGLIKTVREALDSPLTIEDAVTKERRQRALPIDSYWVKGGPHFEMTVCRSLYQVTLLVRTPHAPSPPAGIWAEDTPVWIVRRDITHDATQEVTTADPGTETREGQVEREDLEWQRPARSRIVTVRLRPRASS